jgi:hypothetical protein
MNRRLALAVFLAIGLSACGSRTEPEAAGTSPAPATTDEVSAWIECVNDHEGFAISYPRTWHTATLAPEDECSFFDPKPFELVEGSEYPSTALEAHFVDAPFDKVLADFTDPRFWDQSDHWEAMTGWGRTVQFEAYATGMGLLDAGASVGGYLIDRGDRTFVLQSTRPPGDISEEPGIVRDKSMATLRFLEPSAQTLPAVVARKRVEILQTLKGRRFEELADLIPKGGFTYTYGEPFEGGPIAYWTELSKTEAPLEKLEAVLQLPYTKVGDEYIWPFAYDRDPASLTPGAREQLIASGLVTEKQLDQMAELGHYLGWRAGIRSDGTWLFFVAGD